MTQSPQSRSVGGGGAATGAGIVFQQQLGALLAASLLAGHSLDSRFGLGGAAAVWLRFETEAPVDDILVATSDDGFIAIQAKTTASLSRDLQSPFGKTVAQFVRHWLVCRNGDGKRGWNRPLDPARDRLVLAVGPEASAPVRNHLPDALRLSTQPGGATLTEGQTQAKEAFEACIRAAWTSVTKEPFDGQIVSDLGRLVVVATFNPDGCDQTATTTLLQSVLVVQSDPKAALATLVTICGTMIKNRGSGDLQFFRNALSACGIVLAEAPNYRNDIKLLRVHSESIAQSLIRYERIEARHGMPVTVERDCQAEIKDTVADNSLLIIGEPGTGKSGVLNALARSLREKGDDVLELAADSYSVESLEGLARELKLEHALLDVLKAWDGVRPGWLIIDALDATRGGKGEGVFRTLIQRVLDMRGRWRVIASIRTFDLRMGEQIRSLFKGKPPLPALAEPGFIDVRHVRVPHWSESEFKQLLDRAPDLAKALGGAPERLRELAMVPFNTHLLAELIAEGALDASLREVSSQVELLQLYWRYRVNRHGLPALACLQSIVQVMLETGNLQAPVLQEPRLREHSEMLDVLSRDGVLIRSQGDRWIQFRHHILFDFAAARTALDPDGLVNGSPPFSKNDVRGLMLAPALAFVLQEIWESETNRARFWAAIAHLVSNKANDPVIRSAASRIGAEYPAHAEDAVWLADCVAASDQRVNAALGHIFGALSVRLDNVKDIPLEPWVRLAGTLAPHAGRVADPLRFLLHLLIGRAQDAELRRDLGNAARALLAHAMSLENPGFTARAAIEFVADTYSTDLAESKELLARIFASNRLAAFASEEVPALCRKIAVIAAADPEFAAEIFAHVYGYQVTEDRTTQLSNSQILPLTSNARQDYEMARFHLSEFFPRFLERDPGNAVEAMARAAEEYVARKHSTLLGTERQLTIAGRTIRVRNDQSHIWAYDPDSPYVRDAETLIAKLLQRLRSAPEEEALVLADLLMNRAALAVFWSRLFLAAAERGDRLLDLLWPIAADEAFLVLLDTRKDAIDVVAKGILRRPEAERIALEETAFRFDFSAYRDPEEARDALLRRLFATIRQENLLTRPAQDLVARDAGDDTAPPNNRLFGPQFSREEVSPYFFIRDLDQGAPANAALIAAIEHAEAVLGLDDKQEETGGLALDDGLKALEAVRHACGAEGVHRSLRLYGEGVIGQGCARIVSRRLLPDAQNVTSGHDAARPLLELLFFAGRSENPEVQENTESEFERSPSWGSPAARVDAAGAVLELCLRRPDLHPQLASWITALLTDQHPAVRLEAGLELIHIWNVDRVAFWQRLAERLNKEPNLKILESLLESVVARVLHAEPKQVWELTLSVLRREDPDPKRRARIRIAAADLVAALWVSHGFEEAKDVLAAWIHQPHAHSAELSSILFALRSAVIAGLPDAARHAGVRERARWVFSGIVDAANQRLNAHFAAPEQALAEVHECVNLVDTACQQLYFATGAPLPQEDRPGLDPAGLAQFLRETSDLLRSIGDNAPAHTVYHLLQLLERLVAIDPARAFDLVAHVLLAGGARSGYQYESMGLDLMVRLAGVFLADHKDIFKESDRRAALIECLEIFMEAGWPAAQRLLYRLPELIQ